MRLTAVIIINHYLFEGPQIINLGGRFSFHFSKINSKEVYVSKTEDEDFIEGFFHKDISLLSTIVGSNGSGKTTLISIINQWNDDTKAIFVYEKKKGKNWEFLIKNSTGNRDKNGNPTSKGQLKFYIDQKGYLSDPITDIPPLYYSPIVDYDLKDISSTISKTTHFKSTLEDYFLDNVERNVMFLGSDVIDELQKIYADIPLYNLLEIKAKKLYKRDLRNAYGGFKGEGDIEIAQKRVLDELWDSYKVSDSETEHLTHDSKDLLKNIEVNILSYLVIDGTAISTPFIESYDLNIEEVLKVDDFYTKLAHFFRRKVANIDKYLYRKIQSKIVDVSYKDLSKELDNVKPFEELNARKAELISRLYEIRSGARENLASTSLLEFIQRQIESLYNDVSREFQFKNLAQNLEKFYAKYQSYSGDDTSLLDSELKKDIDSIENGINLEFDYLYEQRQQIFPQVLNHVKGVISLFQNITSFYSFFVTSAALDGLKIDGGNLNFDLRKADFKTFKDLITRYRVLIKSFRVNSAISDAQILEFKPDKRLSFGEKSLLDFFSSVYDFTIRDKDHIRQKERYLLLLDETDLGYHPLWKKKFIDAITTVVPKIFGTLTPQIFDDELKKMVDSELVAPEVQIILTTHDPLTLSDIPNKNITYLFKQDSGKSLILNSSNFSGRPDKSFGANITDLLSDSFFVEKEGGLVGDFARKTINKTIEWLNDDDNKKNAIYHKQIIQIIDEPIVQRKLAEMYSEKMKDDISKEVLKAQIEKLQQEFDDKYLDIE